MSHMKILPSAFKWWLISVRERRGPWDSNEGYASCLFSVSLGFFFFLILLIPWQTLMRLQLPGSAHTTSIIHSVQLHPLNTPHTPRHTSHALTCMLGISLKHTYIHTFHSLLNHGLTPRCHCHKSIALFIDGRPKIWAKSVQKRGDTWGIF